MLVQVLGSDVGCAKSRLSPYINLQNEQQFSFYGMIGITIE